MWIATNRFQIHNAHADQFERHWRKRESFLSQMPEFQRFRFLRAPADQQSTEFLSYTEWLSEAGFREWMESSQIKKAHGASTVPREAYVGPPQFKGYEVVLDEVPGGRCDVRSTWLDLRVEREFSAESEAQKDILKRSVEAGLPKINLGPLEGRLLEILTRSVQAMTVLEIGALGGYSASWMARGLKPGGQVYSLEKHSEYAAIARKNLDASGMGSQVTVIEGDAKETLPRILKEKGSFDLAFVDADKASYGVYVEMVIPHLRPGGLLVCDNAYLWGAMNHFQVGSQPPELKKENGDCSYRPEQVRGMFSCWQQLAVHPELASIVLPTGEGMAVAVKL